MNKPGLIYFVGGDEGPIKVGWTSSHGLKERIRALQCGNPQELRAYAAVKTRSVNEFQLHAILRMRRAHVRGEWFERNAVLELVADIERLGLHGVLCGLRREFAVLCECGQWHDGRDPACRDAA